MAAPWTHTEEFWGVILGTCAIVGVMAGLGWWISTRPPAPAPVRQQSYSERLRRRLQARRQAARGPADPVDPASPSAEASSPRPGRSRKWASKPVEPHP